MADFLSPLVNSARLPTYMNRTVRITGKILRLNDATSEAIISASDGGEVRVKFVGEAKLTSAYIEVVGNVTGNDAVRAHAIINMGDDLDLSLVDFTVEKCHDPKFFNLVGTTKRDDEKRA